MAGDLDEYPEPTLKDHTRTGIDAALSAVPGIGGSLQVLVDAVITPSIDKRRDAWFRQLGLLLRELTEKVEGFSPEALAGDETFVTGLITASRVAMGTHLEGKLELLKNCLANMAVRDHDSDDFIDMLFFRFVDELGPEHFVVLRYQADPPGWFEHHGIERPQFMSASPRAAMDKAQLGLSETVLSIVLKDLAERDLSDNAGGMMTEAGIWAKRTTSMGDQLLAFVSEI